MMTVPLFFFGDRNLEEIQQIVISTKVVNFTKQIIGVIVDLVWIGKKRLSEKVTKL